MAKILFITLCDKGALGIRYISSLLQKEDHETAIVYFKEYNQTKKTNVKKLSTSYNGVKQIWHEGVNHDGEEMIFAYPPEITEKELELLCELIREQKPILIGISLATSYFPLADQITTAIKKEFSAPILWGGVGPTTNPEQMIQFCDILAIGEAEYAITELVRKLVKREDYSHISNLWINTGKKVIKNPTNPLILDLDALPFPDFSFENKFLITNNTISRNCKDINNFPGMYTIMTARGCPFSCSFCINDYYRKLYKGEKYVRRRSVQNVIEELLFAKKDLGITYVTFYDEVFTFDKKWIKEFSNAYAEQIKLPFWCNIYPTMVDEEIISWLKDAGVESVTLGIQSGNENLVKKFYTREAPNTKILAAAQLLHKYKIKYYVDIITESPFETEEDCQKTLYLLLKLPRPFTISTLSKLSLFENLYVTQLAKKEKREIHKDVFTYYNYLYLLTTFAYIPKWLLAMIARKKYFQKDPKRLTFLFILHKKYIVLKDFCKLFLPLELRMKIKKAINSI